jgi:4-carboxymuconolactone decarboxylase
MSDDDRTAALKLLQSYSSKAIDEMRSRTGSTDFAGELGNLAIDNVFSRIWLRPGLDLRARSLVTLGILIALRAHDELKVHVLIALKNGCTIAEIEEVLYQSSAYAGFPAANSGRIAAIEALRLEGLIE